MHIMTYGEIYKIGIETRKFMVGMGKFLFGVVIRLFIFIPEYPPGM